MRQAIIWTNADRIHWRIYAALRGDELIADNIERSKYNFAKTGPASRYMGPRLLAWINNHTLSKMWDEITYIHKTNFSGCTFEVLLMDK